MFFEWNAWEHFRKSFKLGYFKIGGNISFSAKEVFHVLGTIPHTATLLYLNLPSYIPTYTFIV